jgi:hypothetical protein
MTTFSMHQFRARAVAAVVLATAAFGAAATAEAASAYDGKWSVTIRASGSECRTTYVPLKIENGSVGYNGYVPVSVSGSVGGNGAVRVSVSGGGQQANASGQLSGNSGSGTWRGGDCSGTWTASRRG